MKSPSGFGRQPNRNPPNVTPNTPKTKKRAAFTQTRFFIYLFFVLFLLFQLFASAQHRASGTRVPLNLFLVRLHTAPAQYADNGLLAADADRYLRRAGAGIRQPSEGLLDNPVLQRMEGQHGDVSARIQ